MQLVVCLLQLCESGGTSLRVARGAATTQYHQTTLCISRTTKCEQLWNVAGKVVAHDCWVIHQITEGLHWNITTALQSRLMLTPRDDTGNRRAVGADGGINRI